MTEQALQFFFELVSCNYDLCQWVYDPEGTLLESTRPDPRLFGTLFAYYKSIDAMLEHGQRADTPMLLSMPLGLFAIAAFEKKDGRLWRAHVLGPAFSAEVSARAIDEGLCALTNRPDEQRALKGVLYELPLVAANTLTQYAVMLHYCLTKEKIGASAIASHSVPEPDESAALAERKTDRHQTWLTEQSILRMVREGDMNYRAIMARGSEISSGVRMSSAEPLRQAKITQVVFISLCTRAAIEGGLSADAAYTLGDSYIQAAEACNSIAEINSVAQTMYEDFIKRVRKCRTGPVYSRVVRACVDYIELNVESEWSMAALAKHMGYAAYYLSSKFKSEVGMSVSAYSRVVKMERAKLLLTTTEWSVLEISERLHYSSRAFFSETFQKAVGVSPAAYRLAQTAT